MKYKNINFRAFTLIELLVVIAIIGILATLAVVALQQARSRARDSKRVADMKQIQTALELFYNENDRYPTEEEFVFGEALISSSTGNILMNQIPIAPIPADKDCDEYFNNYKYNVDSEYSDYYVYFCIGREVSSIDKGPNILKPSGVTKDFFCGVDELNDIDGNSYKTIQMGNQCWMAENLKTTKYKNNDSIDYPGTDNNAWYTTLNGAYAWYENDQETYSDFYGALYNWFAVIDSRGLCPDGWHVPSHDEFTSLERFVCSSVDCGVNFPYDDFSRGHMGISDEGSKLSFSYNFWDIGVLRDSLFFGYTNFKAIPGGARFPAGHFGSLSLRARFFSSSEYDETSAWHRTIQWDRTSVYRGGANKNTGLSVRCIKD